MSEFQFNEAGMRQLQRNRSGVTGRYLGRVGARAESIAKDLATEERLVRSGRYRASIFWRYRPGSTLGIQVGSGVNYAGLIEKGTPPHRILPSRKKALWWTHGADRGWLVPDRPLGGVNHPGTRPYRIIERAIRIVLLRGGLA